MTLSFKEEVVNDCEYTKYNFEHPHFIGYLNKYGEVLDYSSPFGIGGHDNNKLTAYFENYFRMPEHEPWIQQIEERDVIDIEFEKRYAKRQRDYFRNQIEYNLSLVRKYGISEEPYDKFQNDLDMFFYNCYQAETFMDGFGQNCMSLNEPEFFEKFCLKACPKGFNETEEQYYERRRHIVKYNYHWYKKKLMFDWYKTVIVQYMHYHLVERCKKGITTSSLRPYETFYNYYLNDYAIHQIPYNIYDEDKKMYVTYAPFPSDSELRLKEEIQAIKTLVPISERSKYYR